MSSTDQDPAYELQTKEEEKTQGVAAEAGQTQSENLAVPKITLPGFMFCMMHPTFWKPCAYFGMKLCAGFITPSTSYLSFLRGFLALATWCGFMYPSNIASMKYFCAPDPSLLDDMSFNLKILALTIFVFPIVMAIPLYAGVLCALVPLDIATMEICKKHLLGKGIDKSIVKWASAKNDPANPIWIFGMLMTIFYGKFLKVFPAAAALQSPAYMVVEMVAHLLCAQVMIAKAPEGVSLHNVYVVVLTISGMMQSFLLSTLIGGTVYSPNDVSWVQALAIATVLGCLKRLGWIQKIVSAVQGKPGQPPSALEELRNETKIWASYPRLVGPLTIFIVRFVTGSATAWYITMNFLVCFAACCGQAVSEDIIVLLGKAMKLTPQYTTDGIQKAMQDASIRGPSVRLNEQNEPFRYIQFHELPLRCEVMNYIYAVHASACMSVMGLFVALSARFAFGVTAEAMIEPLDAIVLWRVYDGDSNTFVGV